MGLVFVLSDDKDASNGESSDQGRQQNGNVTTSQGNSRRPLIVRLRAEPREGMTLQQVMNRGINTSREANIRRPTRRTLSRNEFSPTHTFTSPHMVDGSRDDDGGESSDGSHDFGPRPRRDNHRLSPDENNIVIMNPRRQQAEMEAALPGGRSAITRALAMGEDDDLDSVVETVDRNTASTRAVGGNRATVRLGSHAVFPSLISPDDPLDGNVLLRRRRRSTEARDQQHNASPVEENEESGRAGQLPYNRVSMPWPVRQSTEGRSTEDITNPTTASARAITPPSEDPVAIAQASLAQAQRLLDQIEASSLALDESSTRLNRRRQREENTAVQQPVLQAATLEPDARSTERRQVEEFVTRFPIPEGFENIIRASEQRASEYSEAFREEEARVRQEGRRRREEAIAAELRAAQLDLIGRLEDEVTARIWRERINGSTASVRADIRDQAMARVAEIIVEENEEAERQRLFELSPTEQAQLDRERGGITEARRVARAEAATEAGNIAPVTNVPRVTTQTTTTRPTITRSAVVVRGLAQDAGSNQRQEEEGSVSSAGATSSGTFTPSASSPPQPKAAQHTQGNIHGFLDDERRYNRAREEQFEREHGYSVLPDPEPAGVEPEGAPAVVDGASWRLMIDEDGTSHFEEHIADSLRDRLDRLRTAVLRPQRRFRHGGRQGEQGEH